MAGFNVTTDMGAHIFRAEMREVAKESCKEAAKHVASSIWSILRAVQETTRWSLEGGWGWWAKRIAHGFVRESVTLGDYAGKSVGGWLRLSHLYFVIEGGTRQGKRGWARRGGENYGTIQGKRRAHEVYLNKARRGPSKAQPFLRPAVEANEARIAEAIAAKWEKKTITPSGRKGEYKSWKY